MVQKENRTNRLRLYLSPRNSHICTIRDKPESCRWTTKGLGTGEGYRTDRYLLRPRGLDRYLYFRQTPSSTTPYETRERIPTWMYELITGW